MNCEIPFLVLEFPFRKFFIISISLLRFSTYVFIFVHRFKFLNIFIRATLRYMPVNLNFKVTSGSTDRFFSLKYRSHLLTFYCPLIYDCMLDIVSIHCRESWLYCFPLEVQSLLAGKLLADPFGTVELGFILSYFHSEFSPRV